MSKTTPRQRKTTGRVMHEFKHGELRRSKRGKGGKVKSRKQAIAIALHEAGASKYDSKGEKRKALSKSKRKEARGATAQQAREGKSHVGAKGRRESSRAMGGENAKSLKGNPHATRAELYEQARKRHIEGRSKMTKQELQQALH